MTFRDNAPGLRALGFNVFPTHAPGMRPTKMMIDPETGEVDEKQIGKAPLVKWKALQTEFASEETIEKWCEKFPKANIAICCGPVSNLLVLDIDGIEAAQALEALEDQHEPLPDSWRAGTSRGAHIYLRYAGDDLRNTNGELGRGIESKTKGATVHAVGSRHRSGHLYEWLPGCSPGDGPLADAPAWLVDLLRRKSQAVAVAINGHEPKKYVSETGLPYREENYRRGVLELMEKELSQAVVGERNISLFRAAADARRWVNSGYIQESEVQSVLQAGAQKLGLGAHEIKNAVDSAFKSAESQMPAFPYWWLRPDIETPRTTHPYAPERSITENPWFVPESVDDEDFEPVEMNGVEVLEPINGKNGHHEDKGADEFISRKGAFFAHWESDDRPYTAADEMALGYCCAQDHTDLGNAQRMLAWYSTVIRYSLGTGWMFYDGTRWVMSKLSVERCAQLTVKRIRWELQHAPNLDQQRAIEKHFIASQGSGRMSAMITCAQALCEFDARKLDQDHYLLNTLSGIVNLRTGEIMPHSPQYLITKIVPYKVAPECDRPERFLRFMQEICCDDDRLMHFLHMSLGYSLSGDTRHQCLFFLFGEGQNGKSQLMNILIHILGDYAVTDRPDIILANDVRGGGNPEYRFIRFQGARVFYTSELPNDAVLGVDTVKRVTGGDKMVGRHLQASHVEFMPTHKVWFMANTKPAVEDQTHGTWRRIRLVPFNAKFDGVTKKDEKEIYRSLLEEEAPQILRWMIEGCMLQAAKGDLDIPPVVIEATAEYKEEEDVLGDFIQDNFIRDDAETVIKADAYDALVKWAAYRQDSRLKKWSRQRFGKRMEENGFRRVKDNKGVHKFKGLTWKPAHETPWRSSGMYVSRPGLNNPPPMGSDWVRKD